MRRLDAASFDFASDWLRRSRGFLEKTKAIVKQKLMYTPIAFDPQ